MLHFHLKKHGTICINKKYSCLPAVCDHYKCMAFIDIYLLILTSFQEMELLILDPAVPIMVGRYRSDVSGTQAQQDNNVMQHHASQQFAMCKLSYVISLYNKTMTCELGFISLCEDIYI